MKFAIIKTLVPFLMLLATHRGESIYIPRDDPLSAPGQDGCANIHNKFKSAGTKEGLSFPFSDLKSCYESFAFDNKRRVDTTDTMKKLINGFYAFTEQAKQPPVQGYNYKAIDIISEIDNLNKKTYNNDYEFTIDATNLITELKDPHTLFFPICYTRFTFTQRIALYAIASEDGTHKIKVFKDSTEAENNDCEVEQIDGVAAIDVLTEYARDKVFVSKDLGVRFNMALASLSLKDGDFILQPRSSQFTLRAVLPEKEATTYTLKCGTNTKTITRCWEAVINNPDDLDKFTDANSYWDNFCTNPPPSERSSFKKPPKAPDAAAPPRNGKEPEKNSKRHFRRTKSKKSSSDKNKHRIRDFRMVRNVAYPINPLTVNQEILKDLSPTVKIENLVFDAKIAQFYMLDNNVGVAVLATYDLGDKPSFNDISGSFANLQTGFKTLADKGASKLVLDLSNNDGGITILSHFINALLFPDASPSLPTDFKLNDIVKGAVSKATDINSANSIFNIGGYLNVDEKPFNSTSEFFISKYIENDISSIDGFFTASKSSFPWKSSDMIILTNGFCGSACASTSLLLSELHDVKSVAVGGFPNTPLSISSFPGGQVYVLDDPLKRGFDLKTDFSSLGLENESEFPKDIPTNTMLTFTVRKSFSIKSGEVLEYSFRPATNHIFFNEESIRDPSKLWSQASTLI